MNEFLDIKPSQPAPRAPGPAPCSCCGTELPQMYEGTDGTVYCRNCCLRGGLLLRGCPQCNDKPAVVTRIFTVKFPDAAQ